MKIVSWNVNGLRAVMSKNFYEFVDTAKPDILCLQETKLPVELADSMEIPFNYKIFSCAEKKGYSGTAIFSNVRPNAMYEKTFDGHPREGRICVAEFGDFTLVNTYVPNSQDGLRRLEYRTKFWDEDLKKYLKSVDSAVVCGDLNVARTPLDVFDVKGARGSAGFTDEERAGMESLLSECGLRDVWREQNPGKIGYTWWSYFRRARERNRGWRIDYFLVSENLVERVEGAGILDDVQGSDHCPVYLSIK